MTMTSLSSNCGTESISRMGTNSPPSAFPRIHGYTPRNLAGQFKPSKVKITIMQFTTTMVPQPTKNQGWKHFCFTASSVTFHMEVFTRSGWPWGCTRGELAAIIIQVNTAKSLILVIFWDMFFASRISGYAIFLQSSRSSGSEAGSMP